MRGQPARGSRGVRRQAAALAGALAGALAFAAAPAFAGPLSMETGMGELVSVPDLGHQELPVLAAGDDGYLVVWRSQPSGIGTEDPPDYEEVRGARVTPNGKLLDADRQGIFFGFVERNTPNPLGFDVAFGGAGYLVVWETQAKIRASLVSASSVPPASVASPSVLLEDTTADMVSPAVVFDSATMTFLVAWIERDTLTRLRGARVSAMGGEPSPAAPFTIAELPPIAPSDAPKPALACDGAGCMVVYKTTDSEEIYGARIAPDDTVTAPFLISTVAGIPDGGSHRALDLAFDGTHYIVVWSLSAQGAQGESIRGARVTSEGVVLDASGVALVNDGGFEPQIGARSGQPPILTWYSGGDQFGTDVVVFASRLDTTGSPALLDPGGVSVGLWPSSFPSGPAPVAIVGPSGKGLVVREGVRGASISSSFDIFASVLTVSDGALTSTPVDEPLSWSWNRQTSPVATWFGEGAGYLFVWNDTLDTSETSIKGPSSLATAVLGESLEAISSEVLFPNGMYYPFAYFAVTGMSNVLIGCLYNNIVADAYAAGAVLIDKYGVQSSMALSTFTALDPAFGSTNIALSGVFDGSAYVIFWVGPAKLLASRVSVAGEVLESDVVVVDDEEGKLNFHERPVASAYGGGGDILVVWQDSSGIFYRRVNTALEEIEVLPALPTKIDDFSNLPTHPAVAYGGDDSYLIVWLVRDDPDGPSTLFGTRVSKDGKRLDENFTIKSGDGGWSPPAVVFDGTSYLVTWEDAGSLFGAWVSPSGVVFDPAGFPVAEPPGLLGPPALASKGDGQTVVAFSRSHFTEPGPDGKTFDVDRARAGIIQNPCAVFACLAPSECRLPGVCNPAGEVADPMLRCSSPGMKADGTPCEGGLCIAGECVAGPPGLVSSAASGGAGGAGVGGSGGAPEGEGGGCACEVVGAARSRGGVMAVAALAVLVARRLGGRRRRR
jgi:hypothetical protein